MLLCLGDKEQSGSSGSAVSFGWLSLLSPRLLLRLLGTPGRRFKDRLWDCWHSELFCWSLRECVTLTNPKLAARENIYWLWGQGVQLERQYGRLGRRERECACLCNRAGECRVVCMLDLVCKSMCEFAK